MDRMKFVSARWRVVGPLALAGAAIAQRGTALAGPTTPQRDSREGEVDPLTSLLSLVPVSAAGSEDNAQIATYANMAAQLAAGEIEPPDSIDDEEAMRPWIHASYPILIAEPLRSMAMKIDRSLVGYDVTDLDQTLEAGEPPEMITLLRGRFDQEKVAAAWEANGYKMLEVEGMTVASLFEDADIDPEIEISRLALARMNNAVFLPDGTLAYAATLPLLESVIATANGQGESLANRIDIAATLASLDQSLASAILVPGASLSIAAQTPVNAPDLEIELFDQMPPIAFGIIGITPGGPTLIYEEGTEPVITMPPATLIYRLLMTQPGTADDAATVADDRLGTMNSAANAQPYTELFGSWEATAVSDDTILAIDLTAAEGRPVSFWPQLLFSRDLLFLAW